MDGMHWRLGLPELCEELYREGLGEMKQLISRWPRSALSLKNRLKQNCTQADQGGDMDEISLVAPPAGSSYCT